MIAGGWAFQSHNPLVVGSIPTRPTTMSLIRSLRARLFPRPAPAAPLPKGGHDLSLHSGERQTPALYASIRLDHRARYEWADARLPLDTHGLDVFCGNGYGTQLLSARRNVLGIDGSAEAIAFASQHYATPRNFFASKYWPFVLPRGSFDFIVSLESIEHVSDPEVFFRELCAALKPGGHMIFSVPNQAFLPFDAKVHVFHKKHFLFDELLALMGANGLELVAHAGQNTYQVSGGKQGPLLPEGEQILHDGSEGQFIVFHGRKQR